MTMSSMPDDWMPEPPDVSHLIFDDGVSVDSFFHGMQMRLLMKRMESS